MNDFSLICRNLFRRKLRAFLMIVSILIAFLIFGVLAAFERSLNRGEDVAAADRLVTVNKVNFTQPMPIAYYNRVRSVEGVRQVTYANWFGGYYQDPKNVLVVFAVDPTSYLDVFSNEIAVTPDAKEAFVRERTSALVGETMATKWGWKIGDRVPIASNIFSQKSGARSWDFTIAGIFTNKTPQFSTNLMLFHHDYFNETRTFGKDTIGWMVLQTTSPAANDRVAKTIDAMFANSSDETSTDTEKAFNRAFAAQLGNIALIVVLVVGAAFATILMIVGNTMVMTVRERTREIGVLKALGFPRGRVLRLVLGESVLLALLGGLVGMALAVLAIWAMRPGLAQFGARMAMTPGILFFAIGLMLALGILTGTVPAINAMRLKIAESLGRS